MLKNGGLNLMINLDSLLEDLRLLHEYALGAHHASDNQNASSVFHTICHKLNDISIACKPGGDYFRYVDFQDSKDE